MKFNREQMLAMRQSGDLGVAPTVPGRGPQPPRPGGPARPGGFAGGPAPLQGRGLAPRPRRRPDGAAGPGRR